MGYELETHRERLPPRAFETQAAQLMRDWQRAAERVQIAVADVAALRGRVDANDPRLIAARLRAAEAHRRRHEIAERIEVLDMDFDPDA
jgi:hypothetical protein